MKKTNYLIITIAIILILSVLMNSNGLLPQSIVNVSQIDVVDQGSFIQAELAVNNVFDTAHFIPKDLVLERFADGTPKLKTGSSIDVRFEPDEPTCRMTLRRKDVAVGLSTFTYYEAFGTFYKNVPIKYIIKKDTRLIKQGVINTSDQTSINITDPQNSSATVNITQIGDLSTGYQCPSDIDFAVIETNDGLRLVDKTKLIQKLNSANIINLLLSCSNPFTWNVCASTILAGTSEVPDFDGFNIDDTDCPNDTSCLYSLGYGVHLDELTTGELVYEMPAGSATKLVLVNMNANFYDRIVFSAPQADVEIVSMNFSKSQTTINDRKTMLDVSIKNTGSTADTFVVRPTVAGNNVSVSPFVTSININSGETKIVSFMINLLNNTNYTQPVTVDVATSGQFSGVKTDTDTRSFTNSYVSVVTPSDCGNGACELLKGETCSSCPTDCGVCQTNGEDELACTSRPADGIMVLGWEYTPAFLLSPSKCDAIYNFGLFFLIIVLVFGSIGMVLIATKIGPRKGGKRK